MRSTLALTAILTLLGTSSALAKGVLQNELNANARYLVESVSLEPRNVNHVSRSLRSQMNRLIGKKYDQAEAESIAKTIARELRAALVSHRIEKGQQLESIRLVFIAGNEKRVTTEATLENLAYHSKQGFTGRFEAEANLGRSSVALGLQSNGDARLERFAGWNARITRSFGSVAKIGLDYEDFRQVWNGATTAATSTGLYRARRNLAPSVTFFLGDYLSVTPGLSFQHLQMQLPAARDENANAVTTTLRLRRRWQDEDQSRRSPLYRGLDAGYNLRAATTSLGSDYGYQRHSAWAYWRQRYGIWAVELKGDAGALRGRAPLFERFVLGNTSTLRGFNKYEITPLGGDRFVHGSANFDIDNFRLFLDAGSIRDQAGVEKTRESTGGGFVSDSGKLAVLVAFPLNGPMRPMFLVRFAF